MHSPLTIFWFRQDLRLYDNPGFLEACRLGCVLAVYILENGRSQRFSIGSASGVYLHHSLASLNSSLNNNLNLYRGESEKIIFQLAEKCNAKNVVWNRCLEPFRESQDARIEKRLRAVNINPVVCNGSYLWTPEEIKKEDGSYYKVFTAYKRKAILIEPRKPLPKPKNPILVKDENNPTRLSDLQLIPRHPWVQKIPLHWTFGEKEAHRKLEAFVLDNLQGYKKNRDYPGCDQTSRLSANLHFGEISPNYIWEFINTIGRSNASEEDLSHFLSEIIWREFSSYLLIHFKKLASDNFQEKFNAFPWRSEDDLLNAWKTGNTGYPLIDAGMRELWETGYMHNRVRMITASFLIKNLMIHWHAGRDWFWDCLVDADLANNSNNWQWVAGCGVDAAPYFRIFNPVTQGEKFDKEGLYTRKFVPELKNLPDNYLFQPWAAPEKVLTEAGVILGLNYPEPVVDLRTSRERALSAYKSLRNEYT